jgi:flagella basal body P-ring formation protein FlgA
MKRLLLLGWAAPLLAGHCQGVEGETILARDVAAVVPAFSQLPPLSEVLAAPVAGVERVVAAPEVVRLLRKFQLELPEKTEAVCFERSAVPLTEEALLPVLREALQREHRASEVEIEILDFTRTPLPTGKLQFARGGLEPSGLWHGRMVYGTGHSMSVWAKVRLEEERTWVEATELLPTGRLIRLDQLTLQTGLRSAMEAAPAESLESVAGKKPIHTIAPGVPIRLPLLIEPPQVERGDKVAVQVIAGGALLQFEAEAETPGHTGDLIVLRNPENGRRFQAKVEGKGKVAIRK